MDQADCVILAGCWRQFAGNLLVLRKQGGKIIIGIGKISQMMTDYPRVISLLSDIENPLKVTMVQREIESLSDEPYFLNLLQHALKDNTLSYNLKLAASVTLNRVISDRFNELNEMQVLKILMEIVLDYQVDIKAKSALETSFTTTLEFLDHEIATDIVCKVANLVIGIEHVLKNNESQIEIEETNDYMSREERAFETLRIAILVLRCLANSQNHSSALKLALRSILQPSIGIIELRMESDALLLLGNICLFWKEMIDKLVSDQQRDSISLAHDICVDPSFNNWVLSLYEIGSLPSQKCYINPSIVDQVKILNSLKRDAASLQKSIVRGIAQNRQSQNTEIWNLIMSRGSLIINTLTVYATHPGYLSAYEEFVTELLGILIILIKENRHLFRDQYSNLMHLIIFPLMGVTEEEMVLFEDDPEEFNNLVEDCCDHQQYGTIKSETCLLLETVCDEQKDAAEYMVQHAIISLKVKLALDENFQKTAQHFLSIETALLVLSVLSYRLSKHPNELQQFKKSITPNLIKQRFTDLQMARLFQFLAYNFTDIYKNPNEGEQWVLMALNSEKHPTVNLCALDFISNVADQYYNQAFLIKFAEKIGPANRHNSVRLTALLKMMDLHYSKISEEGLCIIFSRLCENIHRDIELYHKRQKTHTLDIVKSLQTVRKVIDSGSLDNKPNLKQGLWNFIALLPQMTEIHLDDEVVKIVCSMCRKDQALSQEMVALLPHFMQLYDDERQSQLAYIMLFSQYLDYGTDQIRSYVVDGVCRAISTLVFHFKSNPTASKDKIGIGALLVLLQNSIAIFGNQIAPEQLNIIQSTALSLIPESDNPEQKIEAIIVARALNLVFLLSMLARNDFGLRKLLVFQDSSIFRGYDLGVLTQCISKQIFLESDVTSVTEMINILTKAIWQCRQDLITIKSKKQRHSFISDTKIRIKRVEDYEQILKFINIPFTKDIVPELELRKIIDQMRSNNPPLYSAIIKSLNSHVYQNLKKLITQITIEGRKRNILHIGVAKSGETIIGEIEVRKRKFSQQKDQEDQSEEDEVGSKYQQKKKKKEESQMSPGN